MEKGSADKPESPACGTSSPTSPPRQQSGVSTGPLGRPVGKTSLTGEEVGNRDGVESTTNLLGNDAALLGGAELGSTEAAKDVSSTSHADSSLRGSRHRRHKLKSFSSKAGRHLNRKQSKELAKLAESREAPNPTTAVSSFESARTEDEGAFVRSEDTRSERSDTSRKKAATASEECESPHADSSAHATRPETPELCSTLGSRGKNLSKTSTSILKKRTQLKKPVPSPPRPTLVTPHLGQSDDGNRASTDEFATSACENLVSSSTGSKEAWYPYALGRMSPAFDQTSPALGQVSPMFDHLSSPSVQTLSVPASAAMPLVHDPFRSLPQSVVAAKAALAQPSHASPGPASLPDSSSLPRRVNSPPEFCASPAPITGDLAAYSTAPRSNGQPADALVSKVSEVNSTTGSPQPLHCEMMPPVIGSNAQSPNANLSGAGSLILSQGSKNGHLRRRTKTEPSLARRKTTSVRFGATTFWEITLGSVPPFSGSPPSCAFCCLVAVFSATLVSLALVFFTNRTRATYIEECNSTACVRAASSFWDLIDSTVDPCQDFYGHVCRRWDNITGGRLKFLDHSVQHIARRLNQSLHDADEYGGASRDTRGVAQFYKLCLRFVTSPDRAISRSKIMRSFGAEERDRLLTLTNFSDVVATLTDLSLSRGLNTVFGVKLVRRAGVAVLNVFPGKTLAENSRPPFDSFVAHFWGAWRTTVVSYLYLHLLLEVFRFDYLRSLQDRGAVDLVRECLQASQEALWHTRDVLTTNIFGGRSEGIRESANILRLVAEATSSEVAHWLSWMVEAMRSRAHQILSKVSLHVHDWSAGKLH
ncbi:hypothetical protein HPB52_018656 [Rhipicephalus sanguineus]|uniref:Endothelin-converting enzyme 1 n=1 Tax=Rhipicephalus sanguineus TaxID=34632 RepID=A0A9D4T1I2_RHISA|nr:hypothetical protein HPB52_018656 [Rhipicephalus sanguineus]